MGAVDGQRVDAAAHKLGGAFKVVTGGADGAGNQQAALRVLAGVRVFQLLLNVLDGDQTFQFEGVVDDQQLFDAVFVKDFFQLAPVWCPPAR